MWLPLSGVIQNTSTLIAALKILKLPQIEQKLTETLFLNDILFEICWHCRLQNVVPLIKLAKETINRSTLVEREEEGSGKSWFQNSTPSDSLTILTSVLLSVRAIFMLFTTNAPKNEHQRGFRYVHFLRINRIIDKEKSASRKTAN